MDDISNINKIQKDVDLVFKKVFSRTPLRQRLEDISKEAIELCRYTDLSNLKEETGDLLASTLQLCNENQWDAAELIASTLEKIKRRELQYKTLGRKSYIALIGGAFDPPTIGHIKLAQFVLNSSRAFDEVWLVPCFSHIFGKKMEDPEHRLKMCRLATKNDARIKVFDYEIAHELHGETYHFIKTLLEEDFAKDKFDFSCVIGLDNANTFDKWVNYTDLERMIRFVVVGRQGVKRDEKVDWYLRSPHMYLVPENEIPEISSTIVRNHVLEAYSDFSYRKLVASDVGEDVCEYIFENSLYKGGSKK